MTRWTTAAQLNLSRSRHKPKEVNVPTAAEFFPSNYLRASDLKGRRIRAVIDRVYAEEFNNDGRKHTKPVIAFRSPKDIKPLVCNKTNFLLVAKLHGENSDSWIGKEIGLHAELVSFRGQASESVRVIQPSQEFDDQSGF